MSLITKRLILMIAAGMLLFPTTAYAEDAQFIDVQGHKVHIVDQGNGPTIVLIHGLGADLSRFHSNIDVLAETHRVIALDLLGFGRSDKPNIEYRIQLFVDQIKTVLDEISIDQAALVGNSMGGLVALKFAEQYPDQVNSLVLIAPAFVFGLPEGLTAEMLGRGAAPETKEQMTGYLNRIYHKTVSEDMILKEVEYKQSIDDTKTIQAMALSLANGEDVFTPETVAAITKPTLLIQGVSDGVVPVVASENLVKMIPNAKLVTFEKSGHWPQLEQPNKFNELVIDLFSQ